MQIFFFLFQNEDEKKRMLQILLLPDVEHSWLAMGSGLSAGGPSPTDTVLAGIAQVVRENLGGKEDSLLEAYGRRGDEVWHQKRQEQRERERELAAAGGGGTGGGRRRRSSSPKVRQASPKNAQNASGALKSSPDERIRVTFQEQDAAASPVLQGEAVEAAALSGRSRRRSTSAEGGRRRGSSAGGDNTSGDDKDGDDSGDDDDSGNGDDSESSEDSDDGDDSDGSRAFRKFFRKVDIDGSGALDLEEFIWWVVGRPRVSVIGGQLVTRRHWIHFLVQW